MMREQWIGKLVCPNCRKTGMAELSQTDDLSWDVRADRVPEGFAVIQSQHGDRISLCLLRSPGGALRPAALHFPFAFWCVKTVIRDWIDETVRFNFLAMRGRFIPETMSLRN